MAKKDFSNIPNPALDETTAELLGITPLVVADPQPDVCKKIPGYKVNYNRVQTRSRRVQLMMQPRVYDALKQGAESRGQSVNDYVHALLVEKLGLPTE